MIDKQIVALESTASVQIVISEVLTVIAAAARFDTLGERRKTFAALYHGWGVE